ncbi:hypothetical protein ACET3Z_006216 [Daucus carota]
MIRKHEECGLLHGCKIAKNAPTISHLLFADDCYFFLKATKSEASILKSVLQRYEALSGQIINYDKSEIVFSPNTSDDDRVGVCDSFTVRQVQKPGKYLGMPMCVGRNKTEVFGFLTDRVQQRLKGWYNKELSRPGKVTLLSSSAQTLPSFWMSLFLIPSTMCEEIERKMNAFLWGNGANSKGVKWISWSKMCMPKKCGGLGLRELRKFNLSMLAKQGWRLLKGSNPLASAIMKAKYYPNSSFLDAEVGTNPSYVWRSILASIEVIKAGARKRIGNGRDTCIWGVPWLPEVNNGYVMTPMPVQLQDSRIHSLMQDDGRRWDYDVINDIFQSRDAELIKHIPLPMKDTTDSWFWILDEKGEFTVKSGYRWLQGESEDVFKQYWTKLWSLKLPCKVTSFLWRVCKSCLPTAHALATKQVNISILCPWCHSETETDTHVLFSCEFAKTVWSLAGMSMMVQHSPHDSAFMVIRRVFDECSREQCVQMGMLCWGLWNRRNKWVWERANGSAFGVMAAASNLLRDWREAQLSSTNDRQEVGAREWEKPNAGWVKDRYVFHVKRTDGLTVLCMADENAGRRIPFAFMEDIHQRFVRTYGRAVLSAQAYAMNDEFSRVMSQQMEYYSSDPNADRINRLKGEMSQVRNVMIENIDKVLERGDRLELLVDKTENLQGNTFRFRKQTRRFRSTVWWKNVKLTVMLIVLLLVIVYIVMAFVCHGLLLPSCF